MALPHSEKITVPASEAAPDGLSVFGLRPYVGGGQKTGFTTFVPPWLM